MIETSKGTGGGQSVTHTQESHKLQQKSKRFWKKSSYVPSTSTYNLTICDKPKFIWFRNAKVGTRTTFSVLQNASVELTAESLYDSYYFPQEYSEYFKFGFVRNPWDRFVSGWMNKIVQKNAFNLDSDTLAEYQEIESFVDFCAGKDLENWNAHFRHQNKLIDLNEVDFLGRHEHFHRDIKEVFRLLGIPLTDVPAENRTSNRSHYSTYYTDKTRDMIYDMYRKDIQLFGYSFEDKRGQ